MLFCLKRLFELSIAFSSKNKQEEAISNDVQII